MKGGGFIGPVVEAVLVILLTEVMVDKAVEEQVLETVPAE